MAGRNKQRLDELLVNLGAVEDIDKARRLIGAGNVLVNESVCDKVGTLVAASARISVRAGKKYVSRGGDKLASALEGMALSPAGWTCADIGSSTGGFTDCLLQHGARQVYCVDVGYGLLAWRLRSDDRVVVLERTNARYLSREHIPLPIDLAVVDASFISLEPLLPPLLPLFGGHLVRILALVKPQFQLPRELVGKGGVVYEEARHHQALAMVQQFGHKLGLCCQQVVPAALCGTKGNQEYFMLLTAPSELEAGGTETG